jgi:hypothetical protein
MSIWWLVPLFALGYISSTEEREDPARPGPAALVSHAVGIPLSVEQIEERTSNLPDGSSRVEATRSRIYRDSSGRMRIEGSPGSPNESYLFMIDPTSGARVVLSVGAKVAYRVMGPKAGENGFAYGVGGMGEALPEGEWTARTEKLGQRTINGIEVEGERITQTSAHQPPLAAVCERWYSNELKVVVLAVASGPYGKHAARIQNVRREEPDPALFTIPSGYNVINMNLHKQQ